ncbi:MAG: hypothetical protein ACREPE_04470 [Lysobacter sp.]
MTLIAHFVGGPKDGDTLPIEDTRKTKVLIAHDDGISWNYEMQVFIVADERICAFVVEGMSPDQAMINYLENCRIRG